MADVTVHLNRVRFVVVAPYLDSPDPFAVVRLDEGNDDTRFYVQPSMIARGREVAAAINAACDAVEDAVRRKNAVDVESLAPDCEDEFDYVTRRLGKHPAYDLGQSA